MTGKQKLNTEVGDIVTRAGQSLIFPFQDEKRNAENKTHLILLEQRLHFFLVSEDPENTVSR